jgi:hypothetical protein
MTEAAAVGREHSKKKKKKPPTFTLHFYGPRPRPFPHLPPVFSGSITCFERETVEGVDLVKSVLEKRRGAWCTGSSVFVGDGDARREDSFGSRETPKSEM